MHTYDTTGVTFQYNGDFSGWVTMVGKGEMQLDDPNVAVVPMSALEEFVAEKRRRAIITYLERLDTSETWVRSLMHNTAERLGV
jgi:hypothetical protein